MGLYMSLYLWLFLIFKSDHDHQMGRNDVGIQYRSMMSSMLHTPPPTYTSSYVPCVVGRTTARVFYPHGPCALPGCATHLASATRRCSGCARVWYCSRKHQKKHWFSTHRVECLCVFVRLMATADR